MGLLERLLGWEGRHFCQQCAACSEHLPSASALVAHLVRKHFKGSPFPCVVLSCGEMLQTLGQLRHHLRQHAGGDLHACTSCGRSFSTPGSLRRHTRAGGCTPEGPGQRHPCDRCSRTFTSGAGLKRHARAHDGHSRRASAPGTGPPGRACRCADCGTQFAAAAELYAHERSIHDVYRAYECGACERAFTRSADLHRHLQRAHAGKDAAVDAFHVQLDHNGNRQYTPVAHPAVRLAAPAVQPTTELLGLGHVDLLMPGPPTPPPSPPPPGALAEGMPPPPATPWPLCEAPAYPVTPTMSLPDPPPLPAVLEPVPADVHVPADSAPARKRGRPRKAPADTAPAGKRGRPRKAVTVVLVKEEKKASTDTAPPKKRGRPRKAVTVVLAEEEEEEKKAPADTAPPNKRGRPRKAVTVVLAEEEKKAPTDGAPGRGGDEPDPGATTEPKQAEPVVRDAGAVAGESCSESSESLDSPESPESPRKGGASLKRTLSVEEHSWRCTECGVRFKTAKVLRRHLMRHLQMRRGPARPGSRCGQ